MDAELYWDRVITEGGMKYTKPSPTWEVGGWAVAIAATGSLAYVVVTWALPIMGATLDQLTRVLASW